MTVGVKSRADSGTSITTTGRRGMNAVAGTESFKAMIGPFVRLGRLLVIDETFMPVMLPAPVMLSPPGRQIGSKVSHTVVSTFGVSLMVLCLLWIGTALRVELAVSLVLVLPYLSMARPFNTTTPLGKLMVDAGYSAQEVSSISGVYVRTLSDYLSGRKPISDHHLNDLADALGVQPEDLLA